MSEEMKINNNIKFCNLLKDICDKSKILESEKYIQHGSTTLLRHSISVAYNSYRLAIALKLPVDLVSLVRGALLHDYFLYDWHKNEGRLHGFKHPYVALRNANRDLNLNVIEKDIIKKHMFPLTLIPPRYLESALVCLVDKFCSLHETLYIDKLYKICDETLFDFLEQV